MADEILILLKNSANRAIQSRNNSSCKSPQAGSGLDISGSLPDHGTSHGLLPWKRVNKGRINIAATSRKRYFTWKISGCPKSLRAVTLLCEIAEEEEYFLHRFSLEDDASILHQHDALELPMRGDSFFPLGFFQAILKISVAIQWIFTWLTGLSAAQKRIVDTCDERHMGAPLAVISENLREWLSRIWQNTVRHLRKVQ